MPWEVVDLRKTSSAAGPRNESGYGINDQAEFDYVKTHDPTRLAFISQQNLEKNRKTDFEDYHYPKLDNIKAIAASPNRAKVPAFLTEYSPAAAAWHTPGTSSGPTTGWPARSSFNGRTRA